MPKKPLLFTPHSFLFQPNPPSPLTKPYDLFYEYLRISPTYELARVACEVGLTKEAELTLPKDFNQVVETFRLLGNVRDLSFSAWLARCKHDVFGEQHDWPITRVFATVKSGDRGDAELVKLGFENNYQSFRQAEGNAPVMIAAIPLNTTWSEVQKQLRQYWAVYGFGTSPLKPNDQAPEPKIAFSGVSLRTDGLIKGLRLVKVRAANPREVLWRVGLMAEVSEPYNNSPELSLASGRKVATEQEDDERRLLTRITSRILLRAQTVAENVARGRFPCYAPVEKLPFDWERIVKLYDYTPDPWNELFPPVPKETKSARANRIKEQRKVSLSKDRK